MTDKKSSPKDEKQEKEYRYAKTKKRYWTFVLYPESAPSDWKDQLQATGLEVAISPLHDQDKNPTGEIKKAHYHIILCYDGPTTGSAVKRLVDDLSQPMPLPIDSVRGLYRYFTHKDNPEKFQYDERDITTINGFDIKTYADLSSADKTKIKVEITKYIKENDIMEYSTLMDALIELDKSDYIYIAQSNTIYFNTYISSRRNSITRGRRVLICDKDTGEVLSEVDNTREREVF